MKIMQVITRSELGGAQSVVAAIANGLCTEHEIMVIAGEGDGKLWEMLDRRIHRIKCPSLQRSLNPWKDLRAYWTLRSLYRRYRPDVIHLHSSKAGMLGRMAFPPAKTVYTVHGFDSIRLAHRRMLPLERLMQRRCKAIVSVSHYDEQNLRREGITRGLTTVYNGIAPPSEERAFPVIPPSYTRRVLCIARVASPKRDDIFIETARRLPQYAFIWIGNQKEMKDMPKNVFFLGNCTHASRYCASADLFMLPSDYEGLPMVIIEAMSHGKPIVASHVGGISEIVQEGRNGFTVENRADLFAEKIEVILGHTELLDRFSKESLQIFRQRLTAARMVEDYLQIYRK